MMLFRKQGLQSTALILSVLLVTYTLPLSAADVNSRGSIGSVTAIGAVDLRGVRISGDGTLFSGDRMNVGSGAYAKVALGAGPNLEVGAGSDVTVSREADSVQVQMASGNVAFKGIGKTSVHVRIGAYEITASQDASGNVAYVGSDAFGVRVLAGSVSVRNTQTKQSFSVQKGSERLVSLATGTLQTFAPLASAVPAAVPAMPQQQRAKLSTGGWIAVVGTIAGAAAAIVVLTTRNDDTGDDAATRLAQVKAIQNLNALTATATASTTLANTVSSTANSALTAINNSNASNKASLAASAQTTASKASTAASAIASLQAQITALQNAITSQGGAPTAAQQNTLNQLVADLNTQRVNANDSLTALTTLLSQATAAGVQNVPASPNLQAVPAPTIASASVPA